MSAFVASLLSGGAVAVVSPVAEDPQKVIEFIVVLLTLVKVLAGWGAVP